MEKSDEERGVCIQALPRFLRIGACLVDRVAMMVYSPDGPTKVSPKTRDVLLCLALEHGRPVSRDQIVASVWRHTLPSSDVAAKAVKELRQAFGDRSANQRIYIETRPKTGYVLIAPFNPGVDEGHSPGGVSARSVVDVLENTIDASHADATNPSAGNRSDGNGSTVGVSLSRESALPVWMALVVALTALFATAWALLAYRERRAREESLHAHLSKTLHPTIPLFTSDAGPERHPSVSPDGKWIAYESTPHDSVRVESVIWLRSVDGTGSRALHADLRGSEIRPSWAPDSHHLVFERLTQSTCTLVYAEVLSGAEMELGQCRMDLTQYPTVIPDGSGILIGDTAGSETRLSLYTIALKDGSRRKLAYAADAKASDVEGRYSPDGKHMVVRRLTAPYSELFVLGVDQNGPARRLTSFKPRAIPAYAWLDERRLVFIADRADERELATIDIESGDVTMLGVQGIGYISASPSAQVLCYQLANEHMRLFEASLVDPTVPATPRQASSHNETLPARDPLGPGLAFVSDRNGTPKIYFSGTPDAAPDILAAPAASEIFQLRYAADGRHLLFGARDIDGSLGLYSIDMKTRWVHRERTVGTSVRSGAQGPDGTLYYEHSVSGTWQVSARAFDGSTRTVIAGCACEPRLSEDGRWLYFLGAGPEGGLYRIAADGSGGAELVAPEISAGNKSSWDVANDNIYFLASRDGHADGIYRRDAAAKGLGKRMLVRKMDSQSQLHGLSVDAVRSSVWYAQPVVSGVEIYLAKY